MNKIEYHLYHVRKKSRYRANMKAWLEMKEGSDFYEGAQQNKQ